MRNDTGTCDACRESLESYIVGDLGEPEARSTAYHLAQCDDCAAEYVARRQLVASLRALPDRMGLPGPVRVAARQGRSDATTLVWWKVAAASAASLAVLSVSALAVPALAVQLPGLPVSERLQLLQAERDRLEAETETLSERVEQLEIEVKQIGDEKVTVVDSAGEGAVAPEINDAVQRLSMEFIKAQYRGDKAALKEMSTKRLDSEIDDNPDEYLKKPGEVVFAQMTTVGKADDGTLLVFVRLSDAEFSDSTYQENFEIKFEDGRYLVDFVGMDA